MFRGRWAVAFALVLTAISIVFILSNKALSLGIQAAGALPPAHAKVVSGAARVVDGDTIDIGGERVRLEGIDTPEPGQTCPRRLFGTWKCGRKATAALKRLVARHRVICKGDERGKYGRLIATCSVNGTNINQKMVRDGFAWAFVKYSDTYVAEERAARAERLGVWSGGKPQAPWDYRAKRWAVAEQEAPEGCAIKGNISGAGKRIYHAPWSPWYNKVYIDLAKGERWFCSESQAKAAGWRAAYAP